PGEHAGGPFVVARTLLRVVRAGIADAVVHQVEARVVGHPSPHRSAAVRPRVFGPRGDAHVLTLFVERAHRPGPRQHLAVRTHVVRGPRKPAGAEIEPLHPAVDAELAPRRADDHATLHDERGDGRGLALRQIGDLRLPQLSAGGGVDRDGAAVQQIVDDLPFGVGRAAVDRIATGDPYGVGIHVR